MRYALLIAYDGTNFCGWQIQNNGRTVQQALQNAINDAFGKQVCVTASGRTDSGVHARGQVCHFDADLTIPATALPDAINCKLPADVSVLNACVAPEGFDSNRSAKRKTYCYRFYLSKRRNPLCDRYALHCKETIDLQKLNDAAALFVGTHDFKAYCAARSQVKTTVRTVFSAEFSQEETPNGSFVTFTVCGGGFLYNMVRTMAGTALGYAQGRLTQDFILQGLTTGDRAYVGKTLPPQGLTLENVDYQLPLFT